MTIKNVLPHWILYQITINPLTSVHYHLPPPPHPPHPTHSSLPCSLQLALMQVDASEEQVPCDGQGDSDHPQAPSHV